jgi:tRNA(Ile)-lysidine synthase
MRINIKNFIEKHDLIQNNSTIIVGLSGGPDSVCLLNILNSIEKDFNLNLIAAHLDHEWRSNSKTDVIFCENLCKQLNIKFITEKASNLKQNFKHTGSKEDLGRQMRRYFFEQSAQQFNANSIALGQHLQDQEENFFIRLIRGTSLSGLTGIKAKDTSSTNFTYIRPLIETPKYEILQYLKTMNLEYIIDPTNLDESFLRNRIRNKIIPAIIECDERFDSNFLRTLHKLQAADNVIDKITEKEMSLIIYKEELDIKKLLQLDSYIQKRILLKWLLKNRVQFTLSESFLNEVLKFLQTEHGGVHKLGDWTIEKQHNKAKIQK